MKELGPRLLPFGHPLHLVLGFSIWIVWFAILYGGQGLTCGLAAPDVVRGPWNWANASLLLLTLATAGLLALAAWATLRAYAGLEGDREAGSRERFVIFASGVLYAGAAISTLVTGLPLLVLSPCL
jgi:hypothetical protein